MRLRTGSVRFEMGSMRLGMGSMIFRIRWVCEVRNGVYEAQNRRDLRG